MINEGWTDIFKIDIIGKIMMDAIHNGDTDECNSIPTFGDSEAENNARQEIIWACIVNCKDDLYDQYFKDLGVSLEDFQEVYHGIDATGNMLERVFKSQI